MSLLAVCLVADTEVPVQTTAGVVTSIGWSWSQSPPLPVLSLELQPLGYHLAGGPAGSQTLEPGETRVLHCTGPGLLRGVTTPAVLCNKEPARASKAPY